MCRNFPVISSRRPTIWRRGGKFLYNYLSLSQSLFSSFSDSEIPSIEIFRPPGLNEVPHSLELFHVEFVHVVTGKQEPARRCDVELTL